MLKMSENIRTTQDKPMATLKQKTAIKKTINNIKNKTLQPMGQVMLEAGYKESVSKKPQILTNSNAWKEAMASIDYAEQLRQLEEMADISKNKDKDNALRSKKMLFDLGDKFPRKESKLLGLFGDF
jgi:NAD-specific glutamate dehydrogenase